MSDHGIQSCHDGEKIPEKSMQCYQSIWMSHWTHTSSMLANEADNQFSLHYESREGRRSSKLPLLGEQKMESHSPKFVKGLREITEAKMINFMNESLTTSSRKLSDKALGNLPFPMFRSARDRERIVALKKGESSGHHQGVLRLQTGPSSGYDVSLGRTENCWPPMIACSPSEIETQSRELQLQHEGKQWNPEEQVNSNKLPENNRLTFSMTFQDDLLGSTSKVVPYGFDGGRNPIQSFCGRQDDINKTSATFFLHEKKTNNNAAPLLCDPSTSNNQQRDFVGKQFQKMPNQYDTQLFPCQPSPSKVSKLEELHHESYAPSRMPSSLYDVETMRIRTTIDSVEEFSKGPSKFSQTSHHFLITKGTDVNLCDGGQMFNKSTVPTRFKGKTASEFLSLSPEFGNHVRQGVKLQLLDSSTESEGKDKLENVKISAVNLKNESSAETDTMDMNAFRENDLSGAASSPSNKDVKGGWKSPKSQAAIDSVPEEIRGGVLRTGLPDINEELPDLPDVANSADDREASTSRTQSLGVENFLFHAEHPTTSKSSTHRNDPLEFDPCSRWVKRLKLSSSDSSAHGTKISKMGEASSHKKVTFFNKILKRGNTSSEPKVSQSPKQMTIDQTAELQRNDDSSSAGSVIKSHDTALLRSWIRRWCRDATASPKKKPLAVMICEPHSSKATQETFEKKQFPSIAAMALMGKAMANFRPCEFRKSGSFVVWNNKGY